MNGANDTSHKNSKGQNTQVESGQLPSNYLTRAQALAALRGDPTIWNNFHSDKTANGRSHQEQNDFFKIPSGLLRVFLSSTFTDTEVERNQIIERVVSMDDIMCYRI